MTSLSRYEALLLQAADELNARLSDSEITRALFLFAALESVRGFDALSALSDDYTTTALWVVRFILEFRE